MCIFCPFSLMTASGSSKILESQPVIYGGSVNPFNARRASGKCYSPLPDPVPFTPLWPPALCSLDIAYVGFPWQSASMTSALKGHLAVPPLPVNRVVFTAHATLGIEYAPLKAHTLDNYCHN